VDDVEAHVTRAGDAHKGIEIGAVVIELRALLMRQPGNFQDVLFEDTDRVGLVSITAETWLESFDLKSSRSTCPSRPERTVTVFSRERVALAGLVP